MTVNEPFTIPDFESLRCFAAAMRMPTFRAAAREVALTPAALGQRIRLLEERLGVELFARTTRRITPTEAALALAPVAERCLAAARDCARAVRPDATRAAMDIVIGTRHELGQSWLVPQLGELRREMPWLRIHLYFGSGSDLLTRARTAEIDCAITSTRFADPQLEGIVLHEEKYVLVAARSLLRRIPLSRAEHSSAHVLLDAGADLPLFRYFREAEHAPVLSFAEVVRLGAIGPIKHECLRGHGVAVLPFYFVRKELESGRLVRLFSRVTALSDYFRLVLRARDPRRSTFESLAERLRRSPLT